MPLRRDVAGAVAGTALSLGLVCATLGANASEPYAPPPAPAVGSAIHGFGDVTFTNDYITPRGLLVTNTGLTTQILNGLTFDIYKNPNSFIHSASITIGT